MAKTGKLTVRGVQALKPGTYGDGGGLWLRVDQHRRSWSFRYKSPATKRVREMGLGALEDVALAQARELARQARNIVHAERDPLLDREAKEAARKSGENRTFAAVAQLYLETHRASWGLLHAAQWPRSLELYAYPVIGNVPVQDVDGEAVLRVLSPIWARAPETASRIRGRIEAVLDFARAKKWRVGENPAQWRGHLQHALPSPQKIKPVEHQPSLPWQQLPNFLVLLRKRDGMSARAIEFAILTAARSGEVRGAVWSEIDLQAAVWTIPAARMKARKAHRVALSSAAVQLLRRKRTDEIAGSDLLFPGLGGRKPLSDRSLMAVVDRMNMDLDGQLQPWRDELTGRGITVHGFRSTFRVWSGETTAFPREVVEAALAHSMGNKTETAYARTDLLERRRALMEQWADYLTRTPTGRVVLLKSASAS